MALLATVMSVRAEQFDEVKLMGSWELTSVEGDFPYFTDTFTWEGDYDEEGGNFAFADCKYLYLGTIDGQSVSNLLGIEDAIDSDFEWVNGLIYKPLKDWDVKDYFDSDFIDGGMIYDFSITNGNKLHLMFYSGIPSLHFVIESMTDTELHLKSYDGKGKVVYKRVSTDLAIANVNAKTDAPQGYYNLKGVKSTKPSHGVNIIRHKDFAKKIVVK